jgi:hypothetical protein
LSQERRLILSAATIWWANGLSQLPGYVRSTEYVRRNGPDRRVQQITDARGIDDMAYSDFTILELKQRFQLIIDESSNLFAAAPEQDLPPVLADTLARYLPLAVNLNTEKARSELVIAPILADFKLLHRDRISLFSGIDFNVDEAAGLKGRCDYILSRSPEQLALTAPVCVLVEAKNENIVAGIPQCLAEMVAAQVFNARNQVAPGTIYGAVTTGVQWRFLGLDGTMAAVDAVEYPIQAARKVFGILTAIAFGDAGAR